MNSDEWTTIRISRELHEVLNQLGRKSETFNDTITRLIDCEKRNGGE